MASDDRNSAGSITRRNLVAATTVVIAALASRAARAREPEHGHHDGGHWHGHHDGGHCYLRGTAIRTPSGDREISELRLGDHVITYSGQPKPIKWIGRRRLLRDDDWSAQMMPVKLMPSALDDDIPHRELLLSRYHAVYLDGQLIPVGSLVNGRTIIVPRTLPEVLEYFHIEMFEYDVIFAEGAPTETFLPFESRRTFDNRQEYEDLYGAEQAVTHVPFAPKVPALRARFQLSSRLRSAVSPWWDVRTPFDIARDRIEARAERLSAAA
jgi:Hint domain